MKKKILVEIDRRKRELSSLKKCTIQGSIMNNVYHGGLFELRTIRKFITKIK